MRRRATRPRPSATPAPRPSMSGVSSPRIDRFRVRAVRVPMRDPHQTASGVVAESPLVLTDVALDDGTVGHSVIFTYTPPALEPTATLVRNFEALVKGDALAPARDRAEARAALPPARHARPRRHGARGHRHGAVGRARAPASTFARRACSAVASKPVPAYGAVGYDGEAKSARVAEDWAKRGFTRREGQDRLSDRAEDVAVIRAMRSAVGPGVAIMVDYNQSLTPAEAVQRMRVLDGEGLDVGRGADARARLRRPRARRARSATPIQCGENWWGALDFQHARRRARVRLRDARRDEDRRRHRLAARRGHRRRARPARVESPVAGDQCAAPGGDADGALARIRRLVERRLARAARDSRRPRPTSRA